MVVGNTLLLVLLRNNQIPYLHIEGRRLERMPVILSAAKDLARRRQRSKARAQDDSSHPTQVRSREVFSPNVCIEGTRFGMLLLNMLYSYAMIPLALIFIESIF